MKLKIVSNFKYGFTLAEVLITLVIIGVVAAFTIPALINKTQKQETVAGVKKAYSTLQSSIHKMALDKDYPQGDYSFITDANSFFDAFEKTVSTTKRCKGSADCLPSAAKQLGGGNDPISNNTNALITSDGVIYTFGDFDSSVFGILDEDKNAYIGRFWVDVNGQKGPQTYGKDLFAFVLIQGKGVLPAGYGNTDTCNKYSTGVSCAARVLRDNAINYY